MAEAISAVRRAIEAGGLLPRGAIVIAAVSGGVDSMVMLDVLARLAPKRQWRLAVAHVDHGLRAGSAADARFVEAEAARRGVPVTIGHPDVRGRAAREKGGLAAIARAARYEYLRALAIEARDAAAGGPRRKTPVVIATAHTASDQAETVLLRLLRGTGARGLAGIPSRRRLAAGIHVVRPLLGLTREEVLAHAQRFGLTWREDPSNVSPARLRNRVRHEVLPLLRTLQPDVLHLLARAATHAADAAKILARRVSRAFARSVTVAEKGRVVLARERWARLPPEVGALVMRRALAEVRGDAATRAAQVDAACAIAREGKGEATIEGARITATRDRVEIRARTESKRRRGAS